MAATTQQGTNIKIGYGSFAYTGYVFQDLTNEAIGEAKVIKDTNNATHTVLTSDLGTRVSFKAVILDSTGSITPPAKSAVVTLTTGANNATTNYRVESSSVAHTAEESLLNLTLIKEASMTY